MAFLKTLLPATFGWSNLVGSESTSKDAGLALEEFEEAEFVT